MRISYTWLNHHLNSHAEKHGGESYSLPAPEKVAELLIFNALEVESVERAGDDYVLDVKVTPNRAHDCLSHKGIAREVARLLGKPIYPEKFVDYPVTLKKEVFIDITEPKLCPRYMGVVIENVEIKESPEWLKERLGSVGQRPINNIVDITNFVMLETGQPLHAFDLDKLTQDKNGNPSIVVRKANTGERISTLDDKEIELNDTVLVIADLKQALAVAGVKGGKAAEIVGQTKNIVIESANFEPTQVRKASQVIGIRTDSSTRFEHALSPELAEEGMRLAIDMIIQIGGGADMRVGSISDAYPRKRNDYYLGVSVGEVNKVLGTGLKEKDVEKFLKQLYLPFETVNPRARVLELAPEFIGVPYTYAASVSYDAPTTFDCASFTAYLFARAGIPIPRICIDQFAYGEPVVEEALRPGDLVFSATGITKHVTRYETVEFLPGTKVPEGVDHVGIYVGDGEIIHATENAGRVVLESLKSSGQFKNIIGYRRVIPGDENRFVVIVPKERLDLIATRSFLVSGIKEDLIEEIGRAYGYRNIKATKPAKSDKKPINDEKFDKANKIREALVEQGFSEVMTYVFRDNGEIELRNPIAEDKKFLRDNLRDGVREALLFNKRNAPILGLSEIKIFEVGTVFGKEKEEIKVSTVTSPVSSSDSGPGAIAEETLEEAYKKFVKSEPDAVREAEKRKIKYKPISSYPFALRDIAVFVPSGTDEAVVKNIIEVEAGELLARVDLFDRFEKKGKISYAYHLVFQSYEKTLSDEELNEIMEKITQKLNSNTGWQVR